MPSENVLASDTIEQFRVKTNAHFNDEAEHGGSGVAREQIFMVATNLAVVGSGPRNTILIPGRFTRLRGKLSAPITADSLVVQVRKAAGGVDEASSVLCTNFTFNTTVTTGPIDKSEAGGMDMTNMSFADGDDVYLRVSTANAVDAWFTLTAIYEYD